jgi:predicted ribosome quality control (RQC) complex YloA/Tae2 family protein
MHALAAEHLAQLLQELRGATLGRTVREVAPLPPRDLMLVLDDAGESVLRLRLSADPEGPRIHLQNGRVHRHDGPVGPWFESARNLLEGARLAAIEQPRGDRIALLRFDGGRDPDHPRPGLVAELTGRHANLVLVDGSEQVLTLLVEPPRGKQAPRLVVGAPWQPPPGKPRSPGGASDLLEALPAAPLEGPGAPPRVVGPLSWAVEHALGGAASAVRTGRELRALKQRLERRLERARSLVRGLAERAEAAAGAERVRQDGELLKGALGRFARGDRWIELEDWFAPDAPRRRVELDPKLAPQANVEKYFDRYHKLLRAADQLERERGLADERVAALSELISACGEPGADPESLEARAVTAGLLEALEKQRAKRVQKQAPRLPYRRFVATSGAEILVGRNARDNDELTVRIARGNDLWLHTADGPGSHVVLRNPKNSEPHPEDLLDAAHLAAHFSPFSAAARVAVHVARRKHVRKPKGAPAGTVQVAGGKIRQVRIEPARLARLLESPRRGAPAGNEQEQSG